MQNAYAILLSLHSRRLAVSASINARGNDEFARRSNVEEKKLYIVFGNKRATVFLAPTLPNAGQFSKKSFY